MLVLAMEFSKGWPPGTAGRASGRQLAAGIAEGAR
jgi:hypothetical protein